MTKTRDDLFAHLQSLGIETRTMEHPPLHTVAESQELRGSIPGAHTKNLFVKDKKGRLFLIVAQETCPIDLKTLHKRIGASGRLSFASPEQMMTCLGVRPGSVTAFGLLADEHHAVRLVLDAGLLAHDMVNCHPMTNEATTTIAREDLLAFFRSTGHEPLVVDLDTDFGAADAEETD